ncbi:MAG: PEP-CTERM sorting domain-containing protein [Pseudomonadota bacterium]
MKSQFSILLAASLFVSVNASADTLAQWTFETSVPTTAGSFAPEVGSGSALGYHANSSVVYSNPVGNGSGESFSSNFWSVGDYYQFQVSTIGYVDISLSWDQVSSSTGPRDFKLSYSTDGSSFTEFASYSVRNNSTPAWSSTTPTGLDTYTYDLSTVNAIENQASVYFRLVDASTVSTNGGTVATTGTDRVDNFTVMAAPVPEAETYAMMLAGLGLVGFMARRRRA